MQSRIQSAKGDFHTTSQYTRKLEHRILELGSLVENICTAHFSEEGIQTRLWGHLPKFLVTPSDGFLGDLCATDTSKWTFQGYSVLGTGETH